MNLSQARWLLVLGLVLFAVRTGLYIGLLPLNEMPDELEHFKQIRLAQYWDGLQAGRVDPERLMRELNADYYYLSSGLDARPDPGSVEGASPDPRRRLIYYRLLGGLLAGLDVESPGRAWYLCRVVSLLFGLAVLGCAWAAGRILAPEKPLVAAAAVLFLCFLPQYAASCATVSNDRMPELAGALFFLLAAYLQRAERAWPVWLALGLILAGLPLVKKTTFFLLIVAGLAAWPWWRRFAAGRPYGRLLSRALPFVVLAVFLAVTFFPPVANRVVPLLGMPVLKLWRIPGLDPVLFRQPGMLNMLAAQVNPLSLSFWHHLYLNLVSLFQSFWAAYGYLTLRLAGGWYLGAWLVTGLALAGWWRLLYRPGPDWRLAPWQGRGLGLLAAGAFLNLAVVIIRHVAFLQDSLSQGRYVFPTLVPLALLGATGYLALWPGRVRRWALAGGLGWIAAMDLAGLWQTITPYFYFVVF